MKISMFFVKARQNKLESRQIKKNKKIKNKKVMTLFDGDFT